MCNEPNHSVYPIYTKPRAMNLHYTDFICLCFPLSLSRSEAIKKSITGLLCYYYILYLQADTIIRTKEFNWFLHLYISTRGLIYITFSIIRHRRNDIDSIFSTFAWKNCKRRRAINNKKEDESMKFANKCLTKNINCPSVIAP